MYPTSGNDRQNHARSRDGHRGRHRLLAGAGEIGMNVHEFPLNSFVAKFGVFDSSMNFASVLSTIFLFAPRYNLRSPAGQSTICCWCSVPIPFLHQHGRHVEGCAADRCSGSLLQTTGCKFLPYLILCHRPINGCPTYKHHRCSILRYCHLLVHWACVQRGCKRCQLLRLSSPRSGYCILIRTYVQHF